MKKVIWPNAQVKLQDSQIESIYHVLNSTMVSGGSREVLSCFFSALQKDLDAEVVALHRIRYDDRPVCELVGGLDIKGPLRFLDKEISKVAESDLWFVPKMISDFLPHTFNFFDYPNHATACYLVQKCNISGAICVPVVLDGTILGYYSGLFPQPPVIDEKKWPFFLVLGGAAASVLKYYDLLSRYEQLIYHVNKAKKSDQIRLHFEALCKLLDDIDQLSSSELYAPEAMLYQEKEQPQVFALLTQGEIPVLAYISAGYSNSEIASRLFISEGTVKKRIGNIMTKLNLKNRTQLAVYYARLVR